MISDTDLANGKFLKPKHQPKRRKPTQNEPQKSQNESPRKRKKGSKLFSLIVLIVLILLCDFAVRGRRSLAYRHITANRNVVSAITWDNEKPFAIVCGKLTHEGDTIDGYKVVKIHPNKVELLKDGKYLIETVASHPIGATPDKSDKDQPVASLPALPALHSTQCEEGSEVEGPAPSKVEVSNVANPNNQPTHQSTQSGELNRGELAEAARPEFIESVESQSQQ